MLENHVGDLLTVAKRRRQTTFIGIITTRNIVVKIVARKADIGALTVMGASAHQLSVVTKGSSRNIFPIFLDDP